MSKKIITILLTILMIFSICIPTFATEISENETTTNTVETTIIEEENTEETETDLTNDENIVTEENVEDDTENNEVVETIISIEKLNFTDKIDFVLYSEELGIQQKVSLTEENNYTYHDYLSAGYYAIRNITDYSDKYELKFKEINIEISKENSNIKLTPINIPDEEKESYVSSLITVIISSDIKNSENVKFVLEEKTTEKTFEIILSKENNYSQTIDLPMGTYTITKLNDNNKKFDTSFTETSISIDSKTTTIKLNVVEEKVPSALLQLLKDNLVLLILLAGSVIALFIIRYRNGDDLIQINFKKKKKEE